MNHSLTERLTAMSTRTDSSVIEYHDDGSWTTTTVYTEYPATPRQKAAAWGALIALGVVSLAPIPVMIIRERLEDRRQKRAATTFEV